MRPDTTTSQLQDTETGRKHRVVGLLLAVVALFVAGNLFNSAEAAPPAAFTWSMPERFGADANGDHVIDEINGATPASFVDPTTWPVRFDACDAQGAPFPGAVYSWTFGDGSSAAPAPSCTTTHPYAEVDVPYAVTLTVTASGETTTSTQTILPRDHVLVSLGDSAASGEGNPDYLEPALRSTSFDSIGFSHRWNNERCHRSALAGPAQAALRLEQRDPHSSVTFVHLACSGARITRGVLAPFQGIEPPSPRMDCDDPNLPNPNRPGQTFYIPYPDPKLDAPNPADTRCLRPQLEQLTSILGDRAIDAITVSAGINDVSFSKVAFACLLTDDCSTMVSSEMLAPDGSSQNADAFLGVRFDQLADRYDALNDALAALPLRAANPANGIAAGRVLYTTYPNAETRDDGSICRSDELARVAGEPVQLRQAVEEYLAPAGADPDAGVFTEQEWAWAAEAIPGRLRTEIVAAVAAADAEHGDRFDVVEDPSTAFTGHGYCANDTWMRDIPSSFLYQRDPEGSFHPNRSGHFYGYALPLESRLATHLNISAAPLPPHVAGDIEAFEAINQDLAPFLEVLSRVDFIQELERLLPDDVRDERDDDDDPDRDLDLARLPGMIREGIGSLRDKIVNAGAPAGLTALDSFLDDVDGINGPNDDGHIGPLVLDLQAEITPHAATDRYELLLDMTLRGPLTDMRLDAGGLRLDGPDVEAEAAVSLRFIVEPGRSHDRMYLLPTDDNGLRVTLRGTQTVPPGTPTEALFGIVDVAVHGPATTPAVDFESSFTFEPRDPDGDGEIAVDELVGRAFDGAFTTNCDPSSHLLLDLHLRAGLPGLTGEIASLAVDDTNLCDGLDTPTVEVADPNFEGIDSLGPHDVLDTVIAITQALDALQQRGDIDLPFGDGALSDVLEVGTSIREFLVAAGHTDPADPLTPTPMTPEEERTTSLADLVEGLEDHLGLPDDAFDLRYEPEAQRFALDLHLDRAVTNATLPVDGALLNRAGIVSGELDATVGVDASAVVDLGFALDVTPDPDGTTTEDLRSITDRLLVRTDDAGVAFNAAARLRLDVDGRIGILPVAVTVGEAAGGPVSLLAPVDPAQPMFRLDLESPDGYASLADILAGDPARFDVSIDGNARLQPVTATAVARLRDGGPEIGRGTLTVSWADLTELTGPNGPQVTADADFNASLLRFAEANDPLETIALLLGGVRDAADGVVESARENEQLARSLPVVGAGYDEIVAAFDGVSDAADTLLAAHRALTLPNLEDALEAALVDALDLSEADAEAAVELEIDRSQPRTAIVLHLDLCAAAGAISGDTPGCADGPDLSSQLNLEAGQFGIVGVDGDAVLALDYLARLRLDLALELPAVLVGTSEHPEPVVPDGEPPMALRILGSTGVEVDVRADVDLTRSPNGTFRVHLGPYDASLGIRGTDGGATVEDLATGAARIRFAVGTGRPDGERLSITQWFDAVAADVADGVFDPVANDGCADPTLDACLTLPVYLRSAAGTVETPDGLTWARMGTGSITFAAGDLLDPATWSAEVPEDVQDAIVDQVLSLSSLIEGIRALLDEAEASLDGAASGQSIPIVGDALDAGADVAAELEAAAAALEELVGAIERETSAGAISDRVQSFLVEHLGPSGVDLLLDTNGDGSVTTADVAVAMECTVADEVAPVAADETVDETTTTTTTVVEGSTTTTVVDDSTTTTSTTTVDAETTVDESTTTTTTAPTTTTTTTPPTTTTTAPPTTTTTTTAPPATEALVEADDADEEGAAADDEEEVVEDCEPSASLLDIVSVDLRLSIGQSAQPTSPVIADGVAGIELGTDESASGNAGWRLDVAVGVDEDGFYLDPANGEGRTGELTLEANVALPASWEGVLAGLPVRVTDVHEGDDLQLEFAADLLGDEPIRLTELIGRGADVLDRDSIRLSAQGCADLDVDFEIRLPIADDVPAALPGILGGLDLHADWNGCPGSTGEPVDVRDGLAPVATLDLRDLRLDVGRTARELVGPVLENVQHVTMPVQPVIDDITSPIPVLSDLARLARQDEVTWLDVFVAQQALSGNDVTALQTLVRVLDVINSFDASSEPGLTIPILEDDVRISLEAAARRYSDPEEALNALLPTVPGFNDVLGDMEAAGWSVTAALDVAAPEADGAEFSFPVLEEPSLLLQMLFGQDVDLAVFDAGELHGHAGFDFDFGLPFAKMGIRGDADLTGHFAVSYDTAGIRRVVAQRPFEASDLGALVHGLGLNDLDGTGDDVPEIRLDAGVHAYAYAGVPGLNVTARGGVRGFAEANLIDPDGDGKLRYEEIADVIEDPMCLFDFDGRVEAFLEITGRLGPFTTTKQIVPPYALLEFTEDGGPDCALADDGSGGGGGGGGFERQLGTVNGGVLHLNVGIFADFRDGENESPDDPADAAEDVRVTDHGNGTVTVEIDGETQNFGSAAAPITQVTGATGVGDDRVELRSPPPPEPGAPAPRPLVVVSMSFGPGNDTALGGRGADSLNGDEDDDNLTGGEGDDIINGRDGHDVIDGGPGNDHANGQAGNDQIDTGDGNDTIFPMDGADVVLSGAGNDSVNGIDQLQSTLPAAGGPDVVDGGPGTDNIIGSIDGDLLIGGLDPEGAPQGADTLFGRDGNDCLVGDLGAAPVVEELSGALCLGLVEIGGPGGNDTLHGEIGNDVMLGQGGDDTMFGSDGDDLLDAGDGIPGVVPDQRLDGGNGNDRLVSGEGNDTLNGDAGNDTITSGAGDDQLRGHDGNDFIVGGPGREPDILPGNGNDQVDAGPGDDVVRAGNGDDILVGDEGADDLFGDAGADVLNGDGGTDDLYGDSSSIAGTVTDGDDVMRGGPDADLVRPGRGADISDGDGGNDVIEGSPGNDVADGGDGNDTVDGGADADTVRGGAGNDVSRGGDGNDTVEGGAGDDQVHGQSGNDTVNGGQGNDAVVGDVVTFALPTGSPTFPNGAPRLIPTFNLTVAGDDVLVGGGGEDFLYDTQLTPTLSVSDSGLTRTVTDPADHGTIANGATNTRYTPAAGYQGSDLIGYRLNRGGATGTLVASGQATITYVANRPPVAVDDAVTVGQGRAVTGNVLANDTDADGDAMVVTPIDADTEHGEVLVDADGSFRYTPALAFGGPTDGFDYVVADGRGGTDTGHVTVTVVPDTQAPAVDCDEPAGWSATEVSVPCVAFETGSGLADVRQARFTLTTAKGIGTEGPFALDPPEVCDRVGRCTNPAAFDVLVDRKGPQLTSTNDGRTYPAGTTSIVADVTCVDGGSGVAPDGCPDGQALPVTAGPHTFSTTATDAVGNTTTRTFTYSVASGALPVVSVEDVRISEGHTGTRTASVPVSLSARPTAPVSVTVTVSNGTARIGTDVVGPLATSVVRFQRLADGSFPTTRYVTLQVIGDTLDEGNEAVTVRLNAPSGATIGQGTATMRILDDDPGSTAVVASVGDANIVEGNSSLRAVRVPVTLSGPATVAVDVEVTTVIRSARTAGPAADFRAVTETIHFAPGDIDQYVRIPIQGDQRIEGDERFLVRATSSTGAPIQRAEGTVIIVDDEPTAS